MASDKAYLSFPYTFRSVGLHAREQLDTAPPNSYLNMMNALERAENLVSSRYGVVIINRDAVGVGTNNYFFTSPVVKLSKLIFQGSAYRYAGLADGSLNRLTGNVQGQYTQIAAPGTLSGNPFSTVVTNCFNTSQPYVFIADSAASLKDNGTFASPELWGIDAPAPTLNTLPYSPLLTLIDNFATGNTYSTSGFSTAWAYAAVDTFYANASQLITDFPEFLNVTNSATPAPSIAGGTETVTATRSSTPQSASAIYSGFASTPVSAGDLVTLTVAFNGSCSGGGSGGGNIILSYSIDGGSTFTVFYQTSIAVGATIGTLSITIPATGLPNLDDLQVQLEVEAYRPSSGPIYSVTTAATISSIIATITSPGLFGPICNGMLSILNTNSSINIAIVEIMSSGLSAGLYQTLTVTTQTAHGRSVNDQISIYGSSNALVDGFYKVLSVPTSTTLTVAYASGTALSSTGGLLHGGSAAPSTCVLTNEYAPPYPPQMSAWGFYQMVPLGQTSFPVGSWGGTVSTNSTATVGMTASFDLSINNQVVDDDLIVITLKASAPANIANISLQFDVNGSGYTSSYYAKDITPEYFQGAISSQLSAYQATQNQIIANTLGLITGATPNSTTAQLQPGNISTGSDSWTTIYLRRGDFLPVGNAGNSGLDWVNVTGWQLVITTTPTVVTGDGSSTIACNGIYLQWGYGPSSFGGIGYDYRYTYLNATTLTESSPSPIQQFNQQSGYLASLSAPIFLRQAAQQLGQYSVDSQVTHVRMYRRGGNLGDNWLQIAQFPNITSGGAFVWKDVVSDAALEAAPISLVIDNDPPVTSSLVNPIQSNLASATVSPGSLLYSQFVPQTIAMNANVLLVPGQIVDVGDPDSLEQVTVISAVGGGLFTVILRLQHDAGEPVNVYSQPRAKLNLVESAYNQTWLAGDQNNPHYLYFSKPGLPENFSPGAYIPVGSPEYPITAMINWRGTLYVSTTKSWWAIVGGGSPYAQPTGSIHGCIASHGWTETESAIWYRALDGLRAFSGADGPYLSLPVEWLYRQQPFGPVPLTDPMQITQDQMVFYNNQIKTSYISLTNSGERFRIIYDVNYRRFRSDDLQMTATYWEKDTNMLLIGIPVPGTPGSYCVAQDDVYTQDYDDGGWVGSALFRVPINLTLQTAYLDLGKPHYQKQWNMMEIDVNTAGQNLNTELLFFTEPPTSLVLAVTNNATRNKVELAIENAEGYPAYSAALLFTMAVTTAPYFYQSNIYALTLADFRNSFDTYVLNLGNGESKVVKQIYIEYTSTTPITFTVTYDNQVVAPYVFTIPSSGGVRRVIRVRLPAVKCRWIRFTSNVTSSNFQIWDETSLDWKAIAAGKGYSKAGLGIGTPG